MTEGFEKLKKQLMNIRINCLINKGLKEGKITHFSEDIFNKMNNTIIGCLPASFYVKYYNYLFTQNNCFDKSLCMFLSLDDALLVSGSKHKIKDLYGKSGNGYDWVEVGNYVYDPFLMLKFEKETYYLIYECENISRVDKKTYLLQYKDFADKYVTNDYDEFKPNGKRRLDLITLIFQIKISTQSYSDKEFIKELKKYLSLVEYNMDQANERKKFQKVLVDKKIKK